MPQTFITHGICSFGGVDRTVTVALPTAWPRVQPEMALYLLHGAGYDDSSHLGREGARTPFADAIDDLVLNGLLPAPMVVAPHWSVAGVPETALRDVRSAPESLEQLVAWAEGSFGRVDRAARTLAGFSMGAVAVWQTLAEKPHLFSRYIPVGGDCWVCGYEGGAEHPDETAEALERSVSGAQGGFAISAWCGEQDPACDAMQAQLAAMRRLPRLSGVAGLSLGTIEGEGHNVASFETAVICALRDLFAE